MIDKQYKLIIGAQSANKTAVELYDLTIDPGENNNLMSSKPKIVETMQKQMYHWQQSVLKSLTGADYQ